MSEKFGFYVIQEKSGWFSCDGKSGLVHNVLDADHYDTYDEAFQVSSDECEIYWVTVEVSMRKFPISDGGGSDRD